MALEFSIHEITLAVHDIDATATLFSDLFNGETDPKQHWPQKMFELDMGGTWVGDFHFGMVSAPKGEGPVGRFLERRGEGMYEVNVRTNDLTAAVEHMKSKGIRFINEEPEVLRNYDAGHGEILSELRIMFADPKTTHGVMIEVAEWVK